MGEFTAITWGQSPSSGRSRGQATFGPQCNKTQQISSRGVIVAKGMEMSNESWEKRWLLFPYPGHLHSGGLTSWAPYHRERDKWRFYFMKWVEAEALATITEAKVQNFVWKNIFCRFGIPWTIISDNGRQFDSHGFRSFCSSLGIKNKYSSPGHPQANGQTKVMNWTLLKIIKSRLVGA